MADTHNKEITLPEFHKTVDVTNIKEFTLKQLQALDKVLDGKATEKERRSQCFTLKIIKRPEEG